MKFVITVFLFVFLNVIAYAQNKSQLQKEYKYLKAEIQKLENDLKKRKKEQNVGLKEINTINLKIETRKKMVENTSRQLVVIEKELGEKSKEFEKNKHDQELYKQEYIRLIRWRYKNRETNYIDKLAFVMEANSFMGFWSRVKYIKKYSDYTKKQSNILDNITKRIENRVEELKLTQREKSNIIETSKQNQVQLESEKIKRDEMMTQITKDMEGLKVSLAEKSKAANDINNKIKRIIEEEIKKQREADLARAKAKQEKLEKQANEDKNEKNNKNEKSKPLETKQTIAEIYAESHNSILSNSFLGNKGNLPFPVKSGSIVSRFGRQPHPLAPELMIENNGIDIKTSAGSEVMCMYEGIVVQIFNMPNYETSVLVKHGDYFTLYSHLNTVFVKIGSELKVRQTIGRVAHSVDHGFSFAHIQIWHYSTKQNPSVWIKGA